jgi:hypothetical protein
VPERLYIVQRQVYQECNYALCYLVRFDNCVRLELCYRNEVAARV